jgi:ARC6-like, IMS domain
MKFGHYIGLIIILIFSQSLESCQQEVISNILCPLQPEAILTSEQVKEVNLSSTVTTLSSHSSALQPIGYKFTAKKGQVINYKIDNPKMCAWLYDPDNQIVNETTLAKDGIYMLQLAQSQGIGSNVTTITLSPATKPPKKQPQPSIASSIASSIEMTKNEARSLIEKWLVAKNEIFGSSYDQSVGKNLTTDLAYEKNIKATQNNEESALEYLSKNNIYYTYDNQQVDEISQVKKIAPDRVIVIALVTEQRTLHNLKIGRKTRSASYKANNCYEFKNISGQWKISKTPDLNPDNCGVDAKLDPPKNSPANLIAQYYKEINSHQYESAWNKLPINLQENLQLHPQGYQSFVNFYNKLDGIQVVNLALIEETHSSAEVKADLQCKQKNGDLSPLFLRFHIKKEIGDREWKIDKVKFDPNNKSTCGNS